MTRAIKVTFLATALLGLGLGGHFGYFEAAEESSLLESTQYIAPAKVASDFARIQFMHADTDHARQAVMLQIQLLEQLELADRSFHANELALAYIRLAMVEEAAGRPEAEQRALAQARARWQTHSRKEELTDEELKNAAKRIDGAVDDL